MTLKGGLRAEYARMVARGALLPQQKPESGLMEGWTTPPPPEPPRALLDILAELREGKYTGSITLHLRDGVPLVADYSPPRRAKLLAP